MHTWKPDPKARIVIGVHAIRPSARWIDRRFKADSYPMLKAAADRLFSSLGVRSKNSTSHREIKVSDPRAPQIIEQLIELHSRGEFKIDAAWIEDPRPSDRKPGHEVWYKLVTGPTDYKRLAKIPHNLHFEYFEHSEIASGEFLRVVRDSDLTGLASLPLVDSRDTDPKVWREVYAERPLGRGLDHPTLDPGSFERDSKRKGWFRLSRREGQCTAWRPQFWRGLRIDNLAVSQLMQIKPAYFSMRGPERFCREKLPQTHFAYCGWGSKDSGAGAKGRWGRTICCSARAREILIDAGLMKPSRFEPIQIVSAADAQAAILDDVIPYPLPLPVYTPEEAEVERARREKLRAVTPPPKRGLTFESVPAAIQSLERRAASPKRAWTPAREHPDFAKIVKSRLFKKSPTAWQLLAPWLPFEAVLEEGDKQFWFTLCAPEWNTWLITDEGDPDDIPSKHDLVIGQTPFGDWFSFRKGDPLLPGDARIREWDHETSTPRDDWASVLGFAAHLVEIADRAAKIGYKPSI